MPSGSSRGEIFNRGREGEVRTDSSAELDGVKVNNFDLDSGEPP